MIYDINQKYRSCPAGIMTCLFILAACLMLPLSGTAAGRPAEKGLPSRLVDTLPDMVGKGGAYTNSLDLINGKEAGVSVTNDGINGRAVLNSIRVRGSASILGENSPMVIIDGVISDITALSAIYPSDIESFTILKNTSETAPYGSEGAAGVIHVRTRRKTGNGFRISYEGNAGVSVPYSRLKMLDAEEYRRTASESGLYINDGGASTDYYKAVTAPAFVHNHYLALGGGAGGFGYRASAGYSEDNSVMKSKGNNNAVAKLDVTQSIADSRIDLEFGVLGSIFKSRDIADDTKLFYSAACQNPTYPAQELFTNPTAVLIGAPLSLLDSDRDSRNMNIATHANATFRILDSLNLKAFGSYYFTSDELAETDGGSASRSELKKDDKLFYMSLDYSGSWGVHELGTSLRAEYHAEKNSGFRTGVKFLANPGFGYDNLAAAPVRPYGLTGSSYMEKKLLSFSADIKYSVLNRYTFSFNARSDGSSLVAYTNRWGFFPSLSFTWDVAGEPFLADAALISSLSLKAGYGRSGNVGAINDYVIKYTAEPVGVVPVSGIRSVVLGSSYNVNPDLDWETVSSVNAGAELGLWQGRFLLTAEYYYSRTSDMLYSYDVPVPPFTYDKLLANLGSMSNMGVDIGIALAPVRTGDADLVLSMNLAWQKNRLESLSGKWNSTELKAEDITPIASLQGAGQVGGTNNVLYQIVGQPVGVFYLPHCRGLVENPDGSRSYDIADLDGDGVVNLDDYGDRYVAGQAVPKFTLGANVGFRWKDLFLSVQLNGAFGHRIFNGTALAYNNMSSFPAYNVMRKAPQMNIRDQRVSDWWLEKGDYVNVEHVTVGYDIPLKNGPVKALRLSVCGKNLIQMTGYSGMTPMINSHVVNSRLGIDDKCCYPQFRTFSFGLDIRF